MQEKQDQKVVLVSLSIHINLKHEEYKSLTQIFFFFSHSQVLSNFLSNHITMKEIKLFNLSLKHPFGSTFSKSQNP